MSRFLVVLMCSLFAFTGKAQEKTSVECNPDFILGSWYAVPDTSGGLVEAATMAFEFGTDSCCTIIYNGKRMECNTDTRKIKYSLNCATNPMQLDVEVFDISTYNITLKSAIRFIFEITDADHIKTATTNHNFGKRPQSFASGEDINIKTFIRRKTI